MQAVQLVSHSLLLWLWGLSCIGDGLVQAEEADSLKVKAQSRQREYERVVQELAQARSHEQGHWAKAKEVSWKLHIQYEHCLLAGQYLFLYFPWLSSI